MDRMDSMNDMDDMEWVKAIDHKKMLELINFLFGFNGFYHCTDFTNFINIMKEGYLHSRKGLENKKFTDAAMQSVVEHTDDRIKDYVRFYWRPKTPTNYRNEGIKAYNTEYHMPIPVYLIFDNEIGLHSNVKFTNMNASSSRSIITDKVSEILSFSWKKIFYDSNRGAPFQGTIPYMCAEFLYPNKISTEFIKKIVFRCEADRKRAIRILGNNKLFIVDSSMFFNLDATKDGKINYINDYRIVHKANELQISIEFKHGNNIEYYKHKVITQVGSTKHEQYVIMGNGKYASTYERNIVLTKDQYVKGHTRLYYYMNDILCIEELV